MNQIGNVVLNYSYYCGKDLYSDGEIEDKLLDIVKNYTKEEYNNIIAKYNEWPIIYHLSDIRENIVKWIPISKTDNVLEIGSGCGAITGVLSEKSQSVTCIELSKKRSLVNAYRNRDKDNIEIIVGNFQEIETNLRKKYDYITLIGVFEYAGLYISADNAYIKFLEIIKKHLNENGKIIIAIENKFGLKYWAGNQEDHCGGYFTSLEGYDGVEGISTFSKEEIKDMANILGLNCRFYYPYPDYKFPMTIYSDDYLPRVGELNNNMNNFDRNRILLFDENKVFDNIIRGKLFPDYSNSFLIVLEKGDK